MKRKAIAFLCFLILVFGVIQVGVAQHISEFTSLTPGAQNTDFYIPNTHTFQYLIKFGDSLTEGGTLPDRNDFAGYVPINGRSDSAYLFINAENPVGGATVLDIELNHSIRRWEILKSDTVDFSPVGGTTENCSGTVTPWNTVITCEEERSIDINGDGYYDFGWCIEIDPATRQIIDHPGGLNGADKLWAIGEFRHENVAIHKNQRTLYEGVDGSNGYLFKFVADAAQQLGSGSLYVYKGSTNGNGNWLLLNNSTQAEQNTTIDQSVALNATLIGAIEDVEISPRDSLVYLAVKSTGRVYRFRDGDPLLGDTVTQFETFVGGMNYDIFDGTDTVSEPWGTGNDNLAFDDRGNLWCLQDGSNNYIWVIDTGHTQQDPKVRIFGRTPLGCEPTGITFTPDFRYLFMSIQHPSSTNSVTSQPDAFDTLVAFDKSVSIVISLNQFLNNPVVTSINTACISPGDSLFVGGSYQTIEGTYYDSLTSSSNGDSIVITDLYIESSFTTTDSVSILPGDSIFLAGSYQTSAGVYFDTLQTVHNCDSIIISILSVVTLSGQLTPTDHQITVYPNPTTGILTIEGVGGTVTIYDIYGRLVHTSCTNIVDISQVASGIYLIMARNDQGVEHVQIIIKE
ncbi:MAG TPA: DUF839 domain-containing protein [Flavobacteriales bacterium]|nr:DUF839 domain-containing protein [Flavobacteriales bacterium]